MNKRKPTQIPKEAMRLRLFLENIEVSQMQLAVEFKVTHPTINRYLTGVNKVPFKLIQYLHLKYKLNFNWFYTGVGPMKVLELGRKNLVSDITDIYSHLSMILSALDKMQSDIKILARSVHKDA